MIISDSTFQLTIIDNKTSSERICRTEKDVKVKERMLLVLNVVYYDKIASQVVRTLDKRKGWVSQWLKRYREKGLEGLKDKQKGGRHSQISKQVEYRVRKILKERDTGWTTEEVEELIIRESGIRYHHNYIYYIVRKSGFKQKVPRKVHVNTSSKEEKEIFKKKTSRIVVGIQHQKQKKEFILVVLDESFLFYDSLIRRVWINANKRPVVRITGSNKHSCLFGAIDIEGKQLFRQYDKFNGNTFLDFLKTIHSKFPRHYIFMDKALPHYSSRKVKYYLGENKDTLIPVYLPTASPEFMMLEEVCASQT